MSNAGLRNSLSDRQIMLVNAEYDRKRKSKAVVFLLWFFLGGFGAHRFYTGQIGYAVCMLIFGWMTLGIWPFIDGIVLLVSRVDQMNEALEQEIIYSVKQSAATQE